MDAELHLKREAQKDPEFELQVAEWIVGVSGAPLANMTDLWISLRSGVTLCELINAIVPQSIKRYGKTNLLPLVEMDNIQLYLKACWNMGVPSGDFFIVSDLYQKKSMPQVIQNIVSLSRVAAALGVGDPIVAANSNKDRVKAWDTVAMGGKSLRIEDLEAGTPAERITQLSVALGEARHELDASRSDNHHLQASMKELKGKHKTESQRWIGEKDTLEKRLQKFAPIDDGGDGAPGSQAVQALELHYKSETGALQAELQSERDRYAALEKRFQDLKNKQSQTALELSKLKMEAKKSGGVVTETPSKPSWMSKVHAKKPSVRAPSIRIVKPASGPVSHSARPVSMALDGTLIEGANYRLSTMLQLKSTTDGPEKHKTGFFFSADELGEEGVSYLSEQLDTLFSNSPIEEDASTILNEMLLADTGRRGFTFLLKQKLRALNFQKVKLDPGPFITLLSLVNSALTGMQLGGGRVDYIALAFLLGASRAVFTTGSRSQMEEHLADHLRDHSIWADVLFWEQHLWDVLPKTFKKKFTPVTLAKAQQDGYADDQLKFLSQFVASFAHEMGRWSVTPEGMEEFFKLIFERLVLPSKYQTVARTYYDKLVAREAAKQVQDSSKLKHVSLVMSSAQMARLNSAPTSASGPAAAGKKVASDANILQGWVKRKVHIMWISEWVAQTGTNLVFREFKTSLQKRVTLGLDTIVKVEIRKDSSLKDSRVIYVEAADMKVTLAPVKDTDAEVNYWVNGLRRMQARFNVAPGTVRSSPSVPHREEQPSVAAATKEEPQTSTATATTAPSSPNKTGMALSSIQSGSAAATPGTKGTSPSFARATPQVGMQRSSSFVVANLEGWMQLNVTKEAAKKIGRGQKAGWHPFWFVQESAKLHLHRAQPDEESLYSIDLADVSQMEITTDSDVAGDVIRLHSSTTVYNLCPANASMFEYWKNGLTACRKRFTTRPPSSSFIGSNRLSSAASESSSARGSAAEAKLEGWVQFRGVTGAASLHQSKSLLGTLKKLGQSKWTPYWLSLNGSTLSIFRSQEDLQLVGELELEGLVQVEETTDKEMFGRVFRLVTAHGDCPLLAPKENESAVWFERLKALVSRNSASASPRKSMVLAAAASPALNRSSVFSNLLGRNSSANIPRKEATERAAPELGESLSGWAHVDEGKRWQKAWLAQKGTILEQRSGPDDDSKLILALDLTRLSRSEAVTGPDAYGPALLCGFDEGKEILFSPERGQQNYWLVGFERLLERYRASPAASRRTLFANSTNVPSSEKPLYPVGTNVWAQHSDDRLWYRAVIKNVDSGSGLFRVEFSESQTSQDGCSSREIRPLDDPAMLALAGATVEDMAPTAETIDRTRPVSVQLPANLAAVLRESGGSFVSISANEALRSRQAEEKQDEEYEANARRERDAEIAKRKADEAALRLEKLRQAKLKKQARLEAEAEAERELEREQAIAQKAEAEEKRAQAARARQLEEEKTAAAEALRLAEERERQQRAEDEEEHRMAEEEEAARLKEEQEQAQVREEKVELARQKAAELVERAKAAAAAKKEEDSKTVDPPVVTSTPAPAATSRSAAVQAALARARERTSAIKSQSSSTRTSEVAPPSVEAVIIPSKPLPDPFL